MDEQHITDPCPTSKLEQQMALDDKESIPDSNARRSPSDDEFEIEFEWDEETMDVQVARLYPIMPPIPSNIDDLSFLKNSPCGNATINIINADGSEMHLRHLSLQVISRASSVLATSFQQNQLRQWELTIHSPQTPIIALLRAIYQGDYTFCEAMIYRPIPLLLHLQIIGLANTYRMPELLEQAHTLALAAMSVNGTMRRPIVQDVCSSIKFIYTELRAHGNLREALAMYCIVNYLALKGELFRQMAFECPAFHRDLQLANFRDLFSQFHASAITCLPVCEHWIHANDMAVWQGQYDFTCQLHAFEPRDGLASWRQQSSSSRPTFQPASQVTPELFNTSFRSPSTKASTSQGVEKGLSLAIRTKPLDNALGDPGPKPNGDNELILSFHSAKSQLAPVADSTEQQSSALSGGAVSKAGKGARIDHASSQNMSSADDPDCSSNVPATTTKRKEADLEEWYDVAMETDLSGSQRESFAELSDTNWTDLGSLLPQRNPDTTDDYEIISSDSEWSVVDKT